MMVDDGYMMVTTLHGYMMGDGSWNLSVLENKTVRDQLYVPPALVPRTTPLRM